MRYHPDQNIQLSNTPNNSNPQQRKSDEIRSVKWDLDSYIAGWWDHLHQHQPTESGGGHCRVWKQVVGTKSLSQKIEIAILRRDMEYALDKLDGEELDGRRIRLIEEGGGPGPGPGPDLGPEPGQGPGNPKMITSNEIMRW